MSSVTMNLATDWVHTAVINNELTYNVLQSVVARWTADDSGSIIEYRDELREVVEEHYEEIGLERIDVDDPNLDYGVMIQWEAQ